MTVPNVLLVREKPDEEIVTGEIEGGDEEIKEEEPAKLRGGNFRSRIRRNQPFSMNTSSGSQKSETTTTKPDGSIVRTIVEITGNQKKTTTITTKGNSTRTSTKTETIGSSGGNKGSSNNYSNWGFGGNDDFDKMWNDQINQMNKNFSNYGGNGQWYEWSSNSNNNNNGKKNYSQWGYDWGDNTNNNKKKNDDWGYDWGDDNQSSSKKTEVISGNDFQQSALDAHNKYRQKHHVSNLVLSKDLCNIAQKYAETLARTGNFAHSGDSYNGNPMGENLFACYGMKITGKMMTDDWYNEIQQ